MSIQNLRKEVAKPGQKLRKSVSNELETALKHNQQLENENAVLRAEVLDLAIKNENLLEAMNKSKDKFENDFNRLHEEIKSNEQLLVENSRNCIGQQKKLSEEIKKLKQDNENLKNEKADIEERFTEKLKSLESEIKIIKLDNDTLRANNNQYDERCVKYRMKLKHAVKIVNDLNQMIAGNKANNTTSETTQTECNIINENPPVLDCCDDPRYKQNLNSENLLLSDIFFKPKSFAESELDLFASKSKTRCSFC